MWRLIISRSLASERVWRAAGGRDPGWHCRLTEVGEDVAQRERALMSDDGKTAASMQALIRVAVSTT
jgi:hypothetical protein